MKNLILIVALTLVACGSPELPPGVEGPTGPTGPTGPKAVEGWTYGDAPGVATAKVTAGDLEVPPTVVRMFVALASSSAIYYDWDTMPHTIQLDTGLPQGHMVSRVVIGADQPFNVVNLSMNTMENQHVTPTFAAGTLVSDTTDALVHSGTLVWIPADDWEMSTYFTSGWHYSQYETPVTVDQPLWWAELVVPAYMDLYAVTVAQDSTVIPPEPPPAP